MDLNDVTRARAEADGRQFEGGPPLPATTPHISVELLRFWRIIAPRMKWIAAAAFCVALGVFLYNFFLTTWYYQATAIILPVDSSDQGMSEDIGGTTGGAGGLAAMLLGQSDNQTISQYYIGIMNSFDFTKALVKRYHLASRIIAKQGGDPASMQPYDVYQWINGNFTTDYDFKSSDVTITYIDPDPAMAEEVVSYYLQSLQDKLRNEAISSADVAAKTLQEEISHTSDTLLQQQLYSLMALQIQRGKLAQLQGDFAFKVIEPPMVPNVKYSPHSGKAGALAGLLTILAMCSWFIFREWLRQARSHLQAWEQHIPLLTEPPPRGERITHKDTPARGEARNPQTPAFSAGAIENR